jgi:hypothetical protein
VYFDGHLCDYQYLHIYMFNIFYLFVDRIMYLETESSVIFYRSLKTCKTDLYKDMVYIGKYMYIHIHKHTLSFVL